MPTPIGDTSPHRNFHTCGRNFPLGKPSPLRIVKCDRNISKDPRDMTGRQKHDVTGDEATVLLKQPRFDQDQAVTGKENLEVRKDTGHANLNDHKRTDSSCTFPAGYGVRSVKSRPPLSNICDEAASAETLPSTLHAPYREGHALPLSELPFPVANLAPIQQPRQSCVLAPHIVITPEATSLEPGRHSLWAAIEVSGRLWSASESVIEPGPCQERSDYSKSLTGCDQQGDPFEFGRLYDLKVQVLPTEKSSVVRVLQNQSFPITLNAGSSVLLLTQTQVDVKLGIRNGKQGNPRQQSDDLIEDLEAELGNSHVGYIEVRLSYRHSAFPTSRDIDIQAEGMLSIQSRVETVAMASVKLHNTMSPWSPPPPEPTPNPLLPLIERH
ncbi:hypothetical protein MRS44_006487 [Fusarium solani]|uniref:uncharacterized protein n=1 Tax=Fusarium solani TaxID=169388 RepID=UPI0032C48900|nr:hypothetical protein MRS44_006487 [Fusarium solani]